KLDTEKSEIAAVTHVDFSARLQTVSRERQPLFHHLIQKFKEKSGCSVLINTSFNLRGEPIVCRPEEAIVDFIISDMDCLFIEDFYISKKAAPDLVDELRKKFSTVKYEND